MTAERILEVLTTETPGGVAWRIKLGHGEHTLYLSENKVYRDSDNAMAFARWAARRVLRADLAERLTERTKKMTCEDYATAQGPPKPGPEPVPAVDLAAEFGLPDDCEHGQCDHGDYEQCLCHQAREILRLRQLVFGLAESAATAAAEFEDLAERLRHAAGRCACGKKAARRCYDGEPLCHEAALAHERNGCYCGGE